MDNQNYTLWQKLNPKKIYDDLLVDIKGYNKADTTNMSELEMNKFRHIAGPAYLTSAVYHPLFVDLLGRGKEFKDQHFQKRGLEDTLYDLENNKKGIEIGLANRNLKGNQKNLFDYIFETEIKPYRKNN